MRDHDAIIPLRLPAPDLEALERFFAGQSSDDETAQIRAWVGVERAEGSLADEVRAVLSGTGNVDVDITRYQRALAERLGFAKGTETTVNQGDTHTVVNRRRQGFVWGMGRDRRGLGIGSWSSRQWLMRGLGSVGAVMVLVAALWIGARSPWVPELRAPARTYATHVSQRAVVRLNDGTRVILAPQSILVVDQAFGDAQRMVTVTGEAYFDVANVAGRPFIVRTGAVTTRVLGTTFTVIHYPDDPDVRIAVESGKVVVGPSASVVLTNNMVARITDSIVTVATHVDLREYTEWTNGRLSFTGAPVSEVLSALNRWYGLEFRLADTTLAQRHITAVFDRDSREVVLQTLQLILGVRMTFHGDIVTLVPARIEEKSSSAQPRYERSKNSSMEVGR